MKPIESIEPIKLIKLIESIKPIESIIPIIPRESIMPIISIGPIIPFKPIQSMIPIKLIKLIESIKPIEPIISIPIEPIISIPIEPIISIPIEPIISIPITPICSITLEPIKNGGITCFGNIYEYDAIVNWLLKNDIDPLNGIEMPTKFIRKINIQEYTLSELDEISKDAKKSLELWCPRFKSWTNSKNKFKKLFPVFKKFNFNDPNWIKYQTVKRKLFLSKDDEAFLSKINGKNLVNACDPMNRPNNTGKRYDFVNLSELTIRQKQFKLQIFRFTNFSNSVFVKCDLSRVRFLGCNLSGTIFSECTFRGEEVCFYKSYGIVKFISCSIEHIDRWDIVQKLDEIVKILKLRLLEGNYRINSDLCCITVDSAKSIENYSQ